MTTTIYFFVGCLFAHFAGGQFRIWGLYVPLTHFTITYLTHLSWTLYPRPSKPRIRSGSTATIVGLYTHLTIVESPFRLLLILWFSHIVRICPYLWLIYELGLYLQIKAIWEPLAYRWLGCPPLKLCTDKMNVVDF